MVWHHRGGNPGRATGREEDVKSSEVIRKVRRTIDRYGLFERGDQLIVGVSAGIDSMVLLHILNHLREEFSFSLIVAHVNHGLRPDESHREAELVQEAARRLHLPLEYKTFDVRTFQSLNHLSLQEAARKIRFGFFDHLLHKYGGGKIALGHHSDDQVETFLIRLLRGSGLKGLKGMLPLREGRVIRPLLEIWREEIESYARENHIPYLTDSSNLKEGYLRNWIRLRLIPFIEKEDFPRFKKTVLKTIEHLREEDDFIEREADIIYRQVVQEKGEKIYFNFSDFENLHRAIQWRVLQRAFATIHKGLYSVDQDWSDLNNLQRRLKKPPVSFSLELSSGIHFEKRYGTIELKRSLFHPIAPFEKELQVPGTTFIEEIETEVIAEEEPWKDSIAIMVSQEGHIALLDFDRLQFPLRMRNFRPGDRFRPLGAGGTQKLKKFFIDHKIPKMDRSGIPLLVSDETIAWVGGYRIDERFKVTPQTKRALKLKILKRSKP